ncbi:hypothetical protein BC941DRAFT_509256 [Chlamydoabsidia padenii]|nr:hypothetical protein BC941DRAFT_509256 [Chlamydoabsidia padenii]
MEFDTSLDDILILHYRLHLLRLSTSRLPNRQKQRTSNFSTRQVDPASVVITKKVIRQIPPKEEELPAPKVESIYQPSLKEKTSILITSRTTTITLVYLSLVSSSSTTWTLPLQLMIFGSACNVFGPVIRCQVTSEPMGGRAELEFLDHRVAATCVSQFNQQIVDGRLLQVSFKPTQSVIAPTRSGYRTTSQVLYTDT